MKPIKNRFFCKDCGRIKMLFETEGKAENFIKFNSENIEEETGFKPERSYFCIACNGWHLTHKKEIPNIKSRTEIISDIYNQERERNALTKAQKKAALKQEQIAQRIKENALLQAQKVEELRKCLDNVETYISILENSEENTNKSVVILNKVFEELENVKSIGVVFKGSLKRRKNAEEKFIILSRKFKAQGSPNI